MTTTPERLAWAMDLCIKLQIRLTPARRRILACLAARETPINLDSITKADELRGRYDAATVYRTLMLLKEFEIVRQISVTHRVRYFVLAPPGTVCAYLVCRSCGTICQIPSSPMLEDFQRLAALQDYADIQNELEFHGICPQCKTARKKSINPIKILIRQR